MKMCKYVCLIAVMYAPFVVTFQSSFGNRHVTDNNLSAVSGGIFLLSTLFSFHAILFSTCFLSRKKEELGICIFLQRCSLSLFATPFFLAIPSFDIHTWSKCGNGSDQYRTGR